MMISKDTFVKTMYRLEELDRKMNKVSDALQELSQDFCSGFYISDPFDIVTNLLIDVFNDKDNDLLFYFMYELDFLNGYHEGCFTDEDGNPIDVSSWEKVYDFLIENMKNE